MRKTAFTAHLSFKRNKIFVDNPHLQSLAALVLLIGKYNKKTNEQWTVFRQKFLMSQIRIWWKPWTWSKKSTLTCAYCGRDDLKVVDIHAKNCATIDHIVPTSKGGALTDPENCCVACRACNEEKSDTI